MLTLHTATRRLGPLIGSLGAAPSDRVREEIHQILCAPGGDALDENAEWPILRRARPLEPFTAG